MNELPPVSTAEILREEFMKPRNMTNEQLAAACHWAPQFVDWFFKNNTPINDVIAIQLADVFGTSAAFWTNLQHQPATKAREGEKSMNEFVVFLDVGRVNESVMAAKYVFDGNRIEFFDQAGEKVGFFFVDNVRGIVINNALGK